MKAYKIDLSGYTGIVRELISKAVQEKAFELGYTWADSGNKVQNTSSLWIDLWSDGGITHCSYDAVCKNHSLISVDDFLSLTTAKAEPEFKPFDKVLVRDSDDEIWKAEIFSHKLEDAFRCVGSSWVQCIPYEGNERRLGTTE